MIKKILAILFMLVCVPTAFAGYYYDDYTDGIFNWTDTNSADWYENSTGGFITSTNVAVYGEAVKDFGSLYDLSNNLNINLSIFNQAGDPSFYTEIYLTDADSFDTQVNYIRFAPAYNYNNVDDLVIICGGSCSCTTNVTDNLGSESDYYDVQIYYDARIGKAEIYRNDSLYVSTYVSGCDVSNWNVTIRQMREPLAYISSFELSAGDYPLLVTDPLYSNIVLNETYADGGIYSNLYNTDVQAYTEGYMWDKDGDLPDKGYLDLNDITEANNPYINWNLSQDWNMTIIGRTYTTSAVISQIILEVGGSLPYTDAFDLNIMLDYYIDSDKYMRSYCEPNGSFCTSGLTYTNLFFSDTADTDEHIIKAIYTDATDNLDVYFDGVLNLSMPLTFNQDATIFMVAVNGESGVRSIVVEQYHAPVCTPNWTCDGYASCLPNSTQVCNSVIDLQACGESYTGDYSEFEPQNCSYITGYVALYSQSDLDNIVSDGLGSGGAVVVAFIPIIIIGGIVIYGYKYMKRLRK